MDAKGKAICFLLHNCYYNSRTTLLLQELNFKKESLEEWWQNLPLRMYPPNILVREVNITTKFYLKSKHTKNLRKQCTELMPPIDTRSGNLIKRIHCLCMFLRASPPALSIYLPTDLLGRLARKRRPATTPILEALSEGPSRPRSLGVSERRGNRRHIGSWQVGRPYQRLQFDQLNFFTCDEGLSS